MIIFDTKDTMIMVYTTFVAIRCYEWVHKTSSHICVDE